jgi:hypothetical protein
MASKRGHTEPSKGKINSDDYNGGRSILAIYKEICLLT